MGHNGRIKCPLGFLLQSTSAFTTFLPGSACSSSILGSPVTRELKHRCARVADGKLEINASFLTPLRPLAGRNQQASK